MFDFVECVCRGKTEFEYESVYLVNHKGNGDRFLQRMSDDSLCIDHHLQKLISRIPVSQKDTNPFYHINHKHDTIG